MNFPFSTKAAWTRMNACQKYGLLKNTETVGTCTLTTSIFPIEAVLLYERVTI
jgi:hypothetical protein